MKFTLIAAALFATITSSFAAGNGWLTNLEEAKVKAAAENKPILIEFTGSDWCPPCKMLNKNVFSTETFNTKAPEKFVLVEMDFPRDTKGLTPEIQQYRQEIAQKYSITGYPSIILTNASGRPIAKTSFRPGGADEYLTHLDEILADSTKVEAAFAAAHQLTGKAKANALVDLLKDKEATEINNFFAAEVAAIKAADPSDSSGFIKGIENKTALGTTLEQINPLAQSGDWDGSEKLISTFLSRDGLDAATKQEALGIKAQILFKQDKKEETLKTIEAAIAIDPSSRFASGLGRFKKHVESK